MKYKLILPILFFTAHLAYLNKFPLFLIGDEFFYTEPASNAGFKTNLYPSTNVSGLYGKVPLVIHKVFFKMFGDKAIRLQGLMWGMISLFPVYQLGGTLAAVLWGLSFPFTMTAHSGRPDMGVCAMALLSIMFFCRGDPVLAGFLAGLALEFHIPNGLAVICGVSLMCLICKRKSLIWLIAGLLVSAPIWLVNHVPDLLTQYQFWHKTQSFSDPFNLVKEYARYRNFFWTPAFHRMTLLLPVVLAALWKGWKTNRPVMVCAIGGIVGTALFCGQPAPYYLNWIFALVCVLVVSLWKTGWLGLMAVGMIALNVAEYGMWMVKFRNKDFDSYSNSVKSVTKENLVTLGPVQLYRSFDKFVPDNYIHVLNDMIRKEGKSIGQEMPGFFKEHGIERIVVSDSMKYYWEDTPEWENILKTQFVQTSAITDYFGFDKNNRTRVYVRR